MAQFCAAIGCTNSSIKPDTRRRNVSFHRFPLKNKLMLRKWLVKLRRANFQPNPGSLLCSEHFTEDDFCYQNFTHRRRIKKTAVPSKFNFEVRTTTKKRLDKKKKEDSVSDEDQDIFNSSANSRTDDKILFSNLESNEILAKEDLDRMLDVSMNERFYRPGKFKELTSEVKDSKTVASVRNGLSSQILLRTLKKQLIETETKAALLKKDYYEKRKSFLPHLYGVVDSDEELYEHDYEQLDILKAQILEDKLAAKVEKRILRSELLDAEVKASRAEKEYRMAKRSITKSLGYH